MGLDPLPESCSTWTCRTPGWGWATPATARDSERTTDQSAILHHRVTHQRKKAPQYGAFFWLPDITCPWPGNAAWKDCIRQRCIPNTVPQAPLRPTESPRARLRHGIRAHPLPPARCLAKTFCKSGLSQNHRPRPREQCLLRPFHTSFHRVSLQQKGP